MFTNVASEGTHKEKSSTINFLKKITYFTIVGFSSPDEGQNTHTIASGHAKACVKPTKVHLQAYPIIPTFASLNKEKNTTKKRRRHNKQPRFTHYFSPLKKIYMKKNFYFQ